VERIVTDFAADFPFGRVPDKLIEHHGVYVPATSVRRICLRQADRIAAMKSLAGAAGDRKSIIAQMDGSMIPIVLIDFSQRDKRRNKTIFWKEAKVCVAYEQGSRTPVYGGTMGDVNAAGAILYAIVQRVGFCDATHVHGVGDGATWIADQFEQQFGTQHYYLIDFFHVCEYIAAAALALTSSSVEAASWLSEQKERLKVNRLDEVLAILGSKVEPETVKDEQAPVRKSLRYLSNRRHQLNYRDAIANGLPIGSGIVESAHKHVLQRRMKIAGGWRLENAERMMVLRIVKANGDWDRQAA